MLDELPELLDETCERIVMDIKKANSAHAYRMLQCLAVAIRPLSVAELAELLSFDLNAMKGGIPELNSNWRWEDHEQAVLSTCSSLITIVPAYGSRSPVVQFSHFSVKEFLMPDRFVTSTKDLSQYHIVANNASTLIARTCLSVLQQDTVDENGAATPLARYAAEHWVAHAQVGTVASTIRDGMEYLFDPDRPYFSAWLKLYNIDNRPRALGLRTGWKNTTWSSTIIPCFFPWISLVHEMVEHLTLTYPQYADAKLSGLAGIALHSASAPGHVEVVRSLLKCGADVDICGVWDRSPLLLASYTGCLNVVQYLLDHGADAKFQDSGHSMPLPLSDAAMMGHLEIVQVLLEHSGILL